MYSTRVRGSLCTVSILVFVGLVGLAGARADDAAAGDQGFNGVGLVIGEEEDDAGGHSISIQGVLDGSPAAQAGVKEGDRITHVDGAPIEGMPLEAVVGLMRGRAGTEVKLTLQRAGQDDPLEVTLVRTQILPPAAGGDAEARARLQAERAADFARMAVEQDVAGGGRFIVSTPGVVGAAVPVELQAVGEYVYVVRGYTLYQFKAEGLQLVAKVDLRTDEEKAMMEQQVRMAPFVIRVEERPGRVHEEQGDEEHEEREQ